MNGIIIASVLFGALLVWLIFKSARNRSRRIDELELLVKAMPREEIEKAYIDNVRIAVAQVRNPSTGITVKQAEYAVELAVACKNRMLELDGCEHGPVARLEIRGAIMRLLKEQHDETRL